MATVQHRPITLDMLDDPDALTPEERAAATAAFERLAEEGSASGVVEGFDMKAFIEETRRGR